MCPQLVTTMDKLAQIKRPIESDFRLYDHVYEDTMKGSSGDNPLLTMVLSYVAAKRGKQLRPILVLLAANMCHGVSDKTLSAAVALEMLHNASLIHDDVVDNSDTRRGTDTVHVRWTNKVAILVGDWMLAKMIGIVGELRNTKILSLVSGMARALSSGELLQLHADSSMWITEEQYFKIIGQKTAALFAACAEIGAVSSGATMKQQTALREYGWKLGLIFQMKDDALDYSDSEELGKPTMNDIRDGKATLPLLVALRRATPEETKHIKELAEELYEHANDLDEQVQAEIEQEIKAFVIRYDGVRYVYQQMRAMREEAISILEAAFHPSETFNSLVLLIEYAINRVY